MVPLVYTNHPYPASGLAASIRPQRDICRWQWHGTTMAPWTPTTTRPSWSSSASRRRRRCASVRTCGTPRRSSGWASPRSRCPTARTACAGCPTAAITSACPAACPATCFPTASALGSSWDTALAERVGDCARGRGTRTGRRRRARPGHQHQALAAVRAQLRVPVRGSGAVRAARRGDDRRRSRRAVSAPRSSTSRPTTRRPTGCGSAPTSTNARCARST